MTKALFRKEVHRSCGKSLLLAEHIKLYLRKKLRASLLCRETYAALRAKRESGLWTILTAKLKVKVVGKVK